MKQLKYYSLLLLLILVSCDKEKLEKRNDKSLLVPATLSDFQALLDNYNLMNRAPGLIGIADGEYVLADEALQNLEPVELNSYLWKRDIFQGQGTMDWNVPYQQIFTANVVLDGLKKISRDEHNSTQYDNIRGSALFFRGFALFNLSQMFASQYLKSTATELPGIPVRTSSDINIKEGRGTLQQTYDQLLDDVFLAEQLLPKIATFKSRPGKPAANALMARVYLAMGNYVKAELYAERCLELKSDLIDYGKIDRYALLPFPEVLPNENPEVLFLNFRNNYGFFSNSGLSIKPVLYNAYSSDDRRRDLFFDETVAGLSFTGYAGLCTDEVYLIKAECLARSENVGTAMSVLNALLVKRWTTDKFIPFVADDAERALEIILAERRKELIGRDLRWMDLKRLNLDKRFSETLEKRVEGVVYSLKPNDPRYLFPIPKEEIDRNGLVQNER